MSYSLPTTIVDINNSNTKMMTCSAHLVLLR